MLKWRMTSTSRPSKLEPIFAADLHCLSPEEKAILVARAAAAAPGFAYELSRSISPNFLLEGAYDPSGRSSKSPVEAAISEGNFALARLWARRILDAGLAGLAPPDPERLWGLSRRIRSGWPQWASAAQESNASDGQIWRARRWLAAHQGLSQSLSRASDLAAEAVSASCSGRPWLAMMCAKELLSCPPEQIAQATAILGEWPSWAQSSLWQPDPALSPLAISKAFSKRLDSAYSSQSNGRSRGSSPSVQDGHPNGCGVLEHLAYWAGALRPSDSALSEQIQLLESALWARGCFAAPKRHAELFALNPYGPLDPRAVMCSSTEAASSSDGSRNNQWGPRREPASRFFEAMLARCSARPDIHGSDCASWDGFVAAHPQCPQADPNPFAVWGGGSAALLSLCGDGRLIERALERGFDPAPSQWVLAAPRAMGSAFHNKRLLAPSLRSVHGRDILAPEGLFIHPRPLPSSGSNPSLHKDGDLPILPKARRPAGKADEHPLAGWTWQSLASVALACGHARLAIMLGGQGRPEATLAQAIKESPPNDRHAIEALASLHEMEVFLAIPADAPSPPARSSSLRI